MVQPSGTQQLGDELVRVIKLMKAAWARSPAPSVGGLDHSAYPILFVLSREPQRMGDLAEAIQSDPSTVSRQVAGLTRAGYVDRSPDPLDGRAQLLRLTPDGHEVIRLARQHREAWLNELLAEWTDHEISTFTTLLGKFADTLQIPSSPPKDPSS